MHELQGELNTVDISLYSESQKENESDQIVIDTKQGKPHARTHARTHTTHTHTHTHTHTRTSSDKECSKLSNRLSTSGSGRAVYCLMNNLLTSEVSLLPPPWWHTSCRWRGEQWPLLSTCLLLDSVLLLVTRMVSDAFGILNTCMYLFYHGINTPYHKCTGIPPTMSDQCQLMTDQLLVCSDINLSDQTKILIIHSVHTYIHCEQRRWLGSQ